jgi:hypothetical protein
MVKKVTKKKVAKAAPKAVPVRSTSKLVRFAAVLLPTGVLVFALAFAMSMVWTKPLVASAFSLDDIVDHLLYTTCHNHLDDNGGHGIDMKDPACSGVENATPEALNQYATTTQGVATSTTLTGTDTDGASGDLLYFSISTFPTNGTLMCAGNPCTQYEEFGSTLIGGVSPEVTYTPNANFVGSDKYDFTVSDGKLENDATVFITVTGNTVEPLVCESPKVLNQTGTECVDPTPVDPVCEAPQILGNHQCVTPAPASNGGGSSNSNGSGNGSGGGGGGVIASGPFSIGYVNTNPQGNGGIVLGTSTVAGDDDSLPVGCSAYLGSYLKFGGKNNAEEVKKLQSFLNEHTGAGLPVTGVFGSKTFEAVKKFQLVQWEKVLKPWVAFGLPTDHTPTGYVYKTTKHTINLMICASLSEPAPQLP